MKLLFDQNLSYKLCSRLADLFPNSVQVGQLGLAHADDRLEFAKENEFVLVTHDSDFADLGTLLGPPPKVIWLRTRNQSVDAVEQIIRRDAEVIAAFYRDESTACLEIYPLRLV